MRVNLGLVWTRTLFFGGRRKITVLFAFIYSCSMCSSSRYISVFCHIFKAALPVFLLVELEYSKNSLQKIIFILIRELIHKRKHFGQ